MRKAIQAASILAGFAIGASACSLFATRPVQEMSDTSAAIKAAREVQADTLAPELYRQAQEWFFKAKREYKFKNFALAQEYADKSRKYAEQAEFHAIRNGASRADTAAPEAPPPPSAPNAYPYPTPTGTPADVYEQRRAAEEAAKKQAAPQGPGGGTGPSSAPGYPPASLGNVPTPAPT
jgi:hypothetical protein